MNRGERFWAKVDKSGDCWEWIGAKNPGGYGTFRNGPRVVKAHRWAYEALVGPIPEGLHIDHLCRNRACVNPEHLEPVTPRENVLRSPIAPAAVNARRERCIRDHEPNWRVTTRGGRECRDCNNEDHNRRYREKAGSPVRAYVRVTNN